MVNIFCCCMKSAAWQPFCFLCRTVDKVMDIYMRPVLFRPLWDSVILSSLSFKFHFIRVWTTVYHCVQIVKICYWGLMLYIQWSSCNFMLYHFIKKSSTLFWATFDPPKARQIWFWRGYGGGKQSERRLLPACLRRGNIPRDRNSRFLVFLLFWTAVACAVVVCSGCRRPVRL